jgi:hypothetical protein
MMKKKKIFISYSNCDRAKATMLCETLELSGFKCWISYRDTIPGKNRLENMLEAMSNSSLMILLFSEKALTEKRMVQEAELGFDTEIPIIPLRIENAEEKGVMKFVLGTLQWIEAYEKPFEEYFPQVITVIKRYLGPEEQGQDDIQPPTPNPLPVTGISNSKETGGTPIEIKSLFEEINASQKEDLNFKYLMFMEQDVRESREKMMDSRKKLTGEWHTLLTEFYPKLAGEFLYILDFVSETFYYKGKKLWTSTAEKVEYNYYKALAVILLLPKDRLITFKELYKGVTGIYNEDKDRSSIQRWFTDLKQLLGVEKKGLNRLFTSWKGNGYKVVKGDEFKFLLILDRSMFQNIVKFSQL